MSLVVHARLGRGIPGRQGIVRQHAGDQLQVALIGAAGEQRLGELQRDVLAGLRGRDVDGRRFGRDLHLLGEAADFEADLEGRRLTGTDQNVLVARRREAAQLRAHDVLRRGRQADQDRAALVVVCLAFGDGVGRLRDDVDAGRTSPAGSCTTTSMVPVAVT